VGFQNLIVEVLGPVIIFSESRGGLNNIMTTHFAIRQATSSSHPLNRRLGATVGDLYPTYHGSPVIAQQPGYAGSSSSKMAREPYTPYQGWPHHSWLARGPPI
jgi:hypothetical protein